MSLNGLILLFVLSTVSCLTVIGTGLLTVGLWNKFLKKSKKEKVKEMNVNKPVMKREEALELLATKPWWINSPALIKWQISSLPASWDGFVSDLARRNDVIGGVKVLKIVQFSPDMGMFGCSIAFDVIQPGGKPGTYMFNAWNKGCFSGSKGVVFVQNDGEITHFIYLTVERFSLGGEMSIDCPGGFAHPGEDALKTMIKEMDEELGVKVTVINAVPLGPIHVDAGVTSNNPELFFVIIDGAGIPEEAESQLLDEAESRMRYHMLPIEQFRDFVADNDDGLTGNIVAKMWAKGYSYVWGE